MPRPRLTPLVESLPAAIPFVGPEQLERRTGRAFDARLGANESVFGPSPRAVAAMQAAAPEAWMYADAQHHALKAVLAETHGVSPENLVIGEGIDGLLGLMVRVLVAPGTPVVTSDGAYPTFNYHVAAFGGRLVKVPYRDDHEDPQALLAAAAREDAPLVYVSNPDNPMGSWHSAGAVKDLIEALPGDAVLCLDEAYAEFAAAEAVPEIDPEDSRVMRMRTFSKAHGLAGARVGYAIGPRRMIEAFNKVRNHFAMTRPALAAAEASARDAAWIAQVREKVEAARARIGAIAEANGLKALPSAANFVAIDCRRDGDFARAVLSALIARGSFVRMPGAAPLDRCIRVTAGTPEMLDAFEAALPGALEAAREAVAAKT